MLRKVITLALALIAGLAVLAGSGRAMAQTTLHTLEHAGEQRTYHLTVPAGYDSAHPAPLLIALHPFGSSGRAMEALTGLDRAAEEAGFLVAYPDSLDLTWNDGRPEVDDSLLLQWTDDLGFVSALLDELTDDYSLDPDRIMLAGFGSGGLLAYRLACEQPEVFSWVAVVSALPWGYLPSLCPAGTAPRNLLIALGSADPSYPAGGRWTGDSTDDDLMRTMSVTETLSFWQERAGCDTEPEQTGRVTHYTDCAEGRSLAFFDEEGVGASWPRLGAYSLNAFGFDLTRILVDYMQDDPGWIAQANDAPTLADVTPHSYAVYVPPELDLTQPAPAILALHGRPGTGAGMAYLLDAHAYAREHSLVMVYPDGANNEWNSVRGFSGFDSSGVDDTDFLVRLVGDLSIDLNLDPNRVFVLGFSNGGFMTQRLACEASDTFAGFAFVGATLFAGIPSLCEDTPPVPILYIHGTHDAVVSWNGITQGQTTLYLSALDTLAFWIEHNGCRVELGEHTAFSPEDPSASTFAHRFTFPDCTPHGDVVFWTIENGGHNLPGVEGRIPPEIAGRVNLDIRTIEVAWDFFSQQSLAE